MGRLRKHWLRVVAHIGALVPFTILLWDGLHDNLTHNPIQAITQRTGRTALLLLVLSLAVTPVNVIFGLKQVVPLRRPLGLYAFFYACLHVLTFFVLDYGLVYELIKEAVLEKRFVLAGLTAFLLLIPLAVTSTKGWQRRLGKRWKELHKLAYLAAPVAILHYVWLVKADVRKPMMYFGIVVLLLVIRLPRVRQGLTKLRHRVAPRAAARTPGKPAAADFGAPPNPR